MQTYAVKRMLAQLAAQVNSQFRLLCAFYMNVSPWSAVLRRGRGNASCRAAPRFHRNVQKEQRALVQEG